MLQLFVLSSQTHIKAPKLVNYLAGFFLFAMWAQFSFEEKSLTPFNFSFLHLPCSYMHIFYLKDLGFYSGWVFFLLFFPAFKSALYTPRENKHSPLPSEQTQQGIRERSFLSAAPLPHSLLNEYLQNESVSQQPQLLWIYPVTEEPTKYKCDILIPWFQQIPEDFANGIILEGKCRSYIDFLNDLKDVKDI